MDAESQAPSLSTLAAHLGVSRMTVSLALRGDPRIRESTRERVVQAAEKMHYKPAPLATAWMRKIRDGGKQSGVPVLAILFGYTEEDFWENPYLIDAWHGARAAARRNGFKIRLLLREAGADSLAALREALAETGASGVVIGLHGAEFRALNLPWETYAWVAMRRSAIHPGLHTVGDESTISTRTCLLRLASLGYRRPGLALFARHEAVHSHVASAAYLSFQQQLPAKDRVPILRLHAPFREKILRNWMERHRPDVVLSPNALLAPIRAAGYRVPTDVGFCGLGINVHHPEMAGVAGLVSPMRKIGQRSVDFLVSLIFQLKLGVPKTPYTLAVLPEFRGGETLTKIA